MDETPYLRRQAALCLNLSRSCSDAQLAEQLDLIAAEFHARALKSEFQAEFNSDDPFDETDIENLRLLLDSSEIADMFDATARQRVGEFISRAASRGELAVPASIKQPDQQSRSITDSGADAPTDNRS